MRWICALTLCGTAIAMGPADDTGAAFQFKKEDMNQLPTGWKAEKTGKGEGSIWKVVADETAPSKSGYALAQTAAGPSALFNLCVAENTNFKDGDISVWFKAIRGTHDQGGGTVWRYQDHDNYYVARMNPLEDNYRLYKTVNGKRVQLATKEGLTVKTGEWHKLKVAVDGDHIRCYLDDQQILEGTDATFTKPGKVGLWSKADAQTRFDQLDIRKR